MQARRIAFYAPMKPPDHPIASGDREIARLVMRALERAGFDVAIASHFIAYQKRPSAAVFAERRRDGEAEADRIANRFEALPAGERPSAWLTYHPYCKAPDFLGPAVSARLGIPYATVEACRTRQDTDADWEPGRAVVRDAIRKAAVNFCLKPSDRAYLETILPDLSTVRPLAPFLDRADLPPPPLTEPSAHAAAVPTIVAAGMMRPGKKEACYLMLADALKQIADRRFRLVAIGDGPARGAIEAAFADMAGRVTFTGALPHDAVISWLDRADLFAWPGHREPIGMVYLEASARGVPIVATRSLGVPLVVADGESGLLSPEGDVAAYAQAIARLLDDPALRARLGAGGRAKVAAEHDIAQASATLKAGLEAVIARG